MGSNNQVKKILFILESRATYGYAKNVMERIVQYPNLDPKILITGGHLDHETGRTYLNIQQDGYKSDYDANFYPEQAIASESWPVSMGRGLMSISKGISLIDPDIVLLFGDRAETLIACIASAYLGKCIAHVQAGDKSGHIDDSARYAIAKFAHLHFASCKDSSERLIKLGEQPNRIYTVGAPQLDNFNKLNLNKNTIYIENEQFNLNEKYLLLLHHPLMSERENSESIMTNLIESCLSFDVKIILIYPNVDAGSTQIINAIKNYEHHDKIKIVKNVDRESFLLLLAKADALVGNSSAGILEAPSFNTPVVNIGLRQRGRPQACNIINCKNDYKSIKKAVSLAMSAEFIDESKTSINPFGDGNSSERICKTLADIELSPFIYDKITTY